MSLSKEETSGVPRRVVSLEDLAKEISTRLSSKLLVVAIVGPPGSGKSTKAAMLETDLMGKHGIKVQILPMDGFHYDNTVLRELNLINRKGAPETFDFGGLEAVLKRLVERKEDVAVPVFDRDANLARASPRLVRRDTRVLLIEGNYLVLRNEPWVRLGKHFDLTVMIECDEQALRRRLVQRWVDLAHSEEEALRKVEMNDIPNARRVAEESLPTDFSLACEC
jgi:pantothenate kinase